MYAVKTEKNVKLKIRSVIKDLTPSLAKEVKIFPDIGENDYEEKPKNNNIETYEFCTDGKITVDGDKISLCYNESTDNGFDNGTVTIIDIEKNTPDIVTMVRTGDAATACRFDMAKRRQICIYEVAGVPVELAICTKTANHSLTENGGKINLDYLIEFRGMSTQRNRLEIEVN